MYYVLKISFYPLEMTLMKLSSSSLHGIDALGYMNGRLDGLLNAWLAKFVRWLLNFV